MSDKKEIATLSIKISVDSTDLDKLEAQLKRIEGLMVSAGLKQPTSVGFSADKFFITNGQVLIDESCIDKAAIGKIVIQPPTTTIRTSARYDDKQQTARAQLEPDSVKSKGLDSKVAYRVCGMSIMRDGSILFGSEGYMGRENSDAAIARGGRMFRVLR